MAGAIGFEFRRKLPSAHLRVHTIYMKNITLSAQDDAIEGARKVAAHQHRTLNEMFREWLEQINQLNEQDTSSKLEDLWSRSGYLSVGKKLSRDEMNER